MSRNQQYKRLSPRRNLTTAVGVLAKGLFAVGYTVEIGEGGMRIHGTIAVESGYHVLVSFSLERDTLKILHGIVRFCRHHEDGKTEFGLQFIDLPPSICRSIRTYVAEKSVSEANYERDRWFDLRGGTRAQTR